MIDVGLLAKVLKNPSDLPALAESLGLKHQTIEPGPLEKRVHRLQDAFSIAAQAAQLEHAETIVLGGSPSMLKGKRVHIIAVLIDDGATAKK